MVSNRSVSHVRIGGFIAVSVLKVRVASIRRSVLSQVRQISCK